MATSTEDLHRLVMPTAEEYEAASRALSEATEQTLRISHLLGRYERRLEEINAVVFREGERAPTLEDYGRAHAYLLFARARLAEIGDYLDVDEKLGCVDMFREVGDREREVPVA